MKKFSLKKSIVTLSLVAATTLGSIQNSHALVALASWNPPLIGAGFLIWSGSMIPAAAGGGLFMVGERTWYSKNILSKIVGGVS